MKKLLILLCFAFAGCASAHATQLEATLNKVDQATSKIWVEAPDGGSIGSGSGFAVTPRLVVTAAHVCEEDDMNVKNVIHRGDITIPLRVAKVNRKADLCVLEGPHGLRPLKVRPSAPRKNERTYIYGAAKGVPDVATEGFAVGRQYMCVDWKVIRGEGPLGWLFPKYECIQRDWRIRLSNRATGGNSGGPVVDVNGNVVSVLVMGRRDYDTITYGVDHRALLEILK